MDVASRGGREAFWSGSCNDVMFFLVVVGLAYLTRHGEAYIHAWIGFIGGWGGLIFKAGCLRSVMSCHHY
jgi:hypothetical protein